MPRYTPYTLHQRPFRPRRHNGLGVAGFIVSLLALIFTCGIFSPLGLLMSVFALFKRPRGFAIAGTVLGMIGTLFIVGSIASLSVGAKKVKVEHQTRRHEAKTQLSIAKAIQVVEKHRAKTSKIPEGVAGNKLVLKIKDSWGRALRYDRHDDKYVIRSAGPDGRFNTADDITPDTSTIDEEETPVSVSGGKMRIRLD